MKQPSKNTENTIFVEAFYILFFGTLTLLIVRMFLLGDNLAYVWDLTALFLITSLYLVLRLTFAKSMHQDYEKEGTFSIKRLLVRSLLASVIFSALMVIIGAWPIDDFGDIFAVFVGGVIFFALMTALPLLSYRLSKR